MNGRYAGGPEWRVERPSRRLIDHFRPSEQRSVCTLDEEAKETEH